MPSPRQEFVPGNLDIESTIPRAFLKIAHAYRENPCLIYRKEHTFSFVPYKRLLNLVENLTLSLLELGVRAGDRVCVLSENRPEWVICDFAVMSLGAIFVPIHTVLTVEQIKNIIAETEPKLLIVSEKRLLSRLIEKRGQLQRNTIILYYDIELMEELSEFKNDRCHFIEALRLMPHEDHTIQYREVLRAGNPNDTASIIYTVGPDGRYRGVELSHKNFLSNVQGTSEAIHFRPEDRFLSVLPLSHAFEKTGGYLLPLFSGSSIVYLTDLTKFSETAKEHKPTVIIGVPRLYEKSYKKIHLRVSKSKFKTHLLREAIEFGSKEGATERLLYKVYDRLVYKTIRNALGGHIRLLISGGAALDPKVGTFFQASGMPVLEGYGLTEFSPIVSVNRLGNNRLGTVGLPVGNAKVRIANDGEILVKGPAIMKGYYRNEATPELHLHRGWLRTGDLGELDADGFLRIIGRKKEIIVLSTGRNVSPISIENQLTHSKFIKQAAIVGDNQKQIAALIVPDFTSLEKKFGLNTEQSVMDSDKVRDFLQEEIDQQLDGFAGYEQVKRFALIANAFTPENSCLNEDLSLNRERIGDVYHSVITKLYENSVS